jgi:hypothetical protein
MARAAIAILLAGLGGTPWGCGREGGFRTMDESAREKAAEVLALEDEEFLALDNARNQALQDRLAAQFRVDPFKSPPGAAPQTPSFVALGAPRSVPAGGPVPVLVGSRMTGKRRWEAHWDQNACLAAVDLASGRSRTGWPFIPGKRRPTPPPSGSGKPPDEVNAGSVGTAVQRIDVRQSIEIPPGPARLAVTLFFYDWISNTAVVEIKGEGKPAEAAPRSASKFLGKAEPGATALVVPAAAAAGAPVEIRGSIDLPADGVAVVPDADKPGARLAVVTVLFAKLDDEDPARAELAVPVEVATGRVKAGFAFDALTALGEDRKLEGTYRVYLLAGATVAGPYPLAVGKEGAA